MSKYIIEIEDEPFGRNDDPNIPHGMDELYRAKGFNSLVFDQFGLDKLTPLDKELEEAYQKGYDTGSHESTTLEYQRGLDDAWETAKYLFSEMSNTEINLVFPQEWNNGGFKALMALDPKDAIDRINAFERKQKPDEIKVGDEVCFVFAGGETIEPFIVFSIKDDNGKKYYEGIQTSDGRWVGGCLKYFKTGKHYSQVEELLKAMKGGA